MVCLNRVRRVCAGAAVITHYSGQAVWRVHVVGAQSVGGRAAGTSQTGEKAVRDVAVCGVVAHVSCCQG